MASKSYIVTGVKSIDRKLKKLEPKLGAKVIRQTLRKEAKKMQASVKSLAPVGETKQLKKNIKVKAMKRSRIRTGVFVQVKASDFEGFFSPASVEWGTSKKPKNPFFRPAYDAGKDSAKDNIINDIKKGLDKITKTL